MAFAIAVPALGAVGPRDTADASIVGLRVTAQATGGWLVEWEPVLDATGYVLTRDVSRFMGSPGEAVETRFELQTSQTSVFVPDGPWHTSWDYRERFVLEYTTAAGSQRLTNDDTCPRAFFMSARGSGQNQEPAYAGALGNRGADVYARLIKWLDVGGSNIRALSVSRTYPAVPVGDPTMWSSAKAGKEDALALLRDVRKGCPGSLVLMFGYSQGAWAAGDAVTEALASPGLRAWVDSNVVRVGLLADARYAGGLRSVWYEPYDHGGGGIAGQRGEIGAQSGIVTSYCFTHDAVCHRWAGSDFHGKVYDCYEGLVARDMSYKLSEAIGWSAKGVPVVPTCNDRRLDKTLVTRGGRQFYVTGTSALAEQALLARPVSGPVTRECLQLRGARTQTNFELQPFVDAGEVGFAPVSQAVACVEPSQIRARAIHTTTAVAPNGYWVDRDLRPHAIPDVLSATCYDERSGARGPIYVMTAAEFRTLNPSGAPAARCLGLQASAGKVLRLRGDQPASGITYLVDGAGNRHHIPDVQTLSCLLSWQDRGTVDGLTWAHVESLPEANSKATCSPPGRIAGKIIRGPSGNAFLVDASLVRHSIDTVYTYNCLVDRGVGVLNVTQGQVAGVRSGSAAKNCISPTRVEGRIIRRSDGVSWVVVNGQRQHIPTQSVDVCARAVHRRAVALGGLDYNAAASIPESTNKYDCNIEGTVVQALDRPEPYPAYRINGGKRFWIPDGWTFDYWKRRLPIVASYNESVLKELPDGGTEPRRLDPAAIPTNSIIRRSDGVSWVVDANRVRHHIPYARDDMCWRLLRGYTVTATGLTSAQASALTENEPWPCVVGPRVVKSDDGKSYFVDSTNTRHWIPDTETFTALSRKYEVVGPWPSAEMTNFLPGADQPRMLDPEAVKNSIVCRSDGVCWAVDGNAVRHHIPTYADNVCWRWVNGWRVTRSGVSYDQANSLGEAGPWGCSMNGRIIATNEGAAYYMDGNTRRWIQDTYDFSCYSAGRSVIRGMAMSEASGIPEGSWMPVCSGPGYRVVTIYSPANGRYVTTEINYGGADYAMIRAARTSVGSDWERFRLIGDCSSRCLIQSLNNRKLVIPQLDYQGYAWGEMRGVSMNPGGSWEGFRLVGDCNTGCAILALGNGRYVSAELGYTGAGYGMLRARATAVGGWERFIIR